MQRHSGSWRTETLARKGKIPPDSWRDWAEKGCAVADRKRHKLNQGAVL